MLIRTHLAFIILALILFVPQIDSKIIFIFVALLATLIPDVDSGFSTLGQLKGFRFLQFFVKHRGIIHSFTTCITLSIILAIFLPVTALPFFLGYGLHLFIDSFTVEGITPFWPIKKKSSWRLRTGSMLESTLFLSLVLADLFLFIIVFWGLF